jgi:hypothetical protein
MALFRRKARATGSGGYAFVRDPEGAVVGLWLPTATLARNTGLVDALLAKEDLWDLLDRRRTYEPNKADDRGGMFVMFGEPAGTGSGAGSSRELAVNGVMYPVHDDFDSFAEDAVAGRLSLLRTPIAEPLTERKQRLFGLLAGRYGESSRQARAVLATGFHCLSCFMDYPPTAIWLRDEASSGTTVAGITSRPGGAARLNAILTMTACVKCGAHDGVWIYDPSREPT